MCGGDLRPNELPRRFERRVLSIDAIVTGLGKERWWRAARLMGVL
jgi:hypothetical protein